MKTRYILLGGTAIMLAACTPADEPATTPPAEDATVEAEEPATTPEDSDLAEKLQGAAAGTYSLDNTHAFLSFTVTHNGVSDYNVDFTDFDATVEFNPEDPATSSVTATIDPLGLNVKYPADYKAGHPDSPHESWPEALSKDARFLNGEEFPEITFVSTGAETTGDYTGTVTGDLTFLGVTKPVTLDVTYNGVANTPWTGERDLIGFNATGTIDRSEFGQTSMEGVISNEVRIEFSGEFLEDEAPAETPPADEPAETQE